MTEEFKPPAAPASLPTVAGLLPVMTEHDKETAIWLSKSALVPEDYQNRPENIIAAAIHGRDLGLNIMQSLQSIAVIGGRPSLFGDAALAIVQRHPDLMNVHEKIEGEGEQRVAVCTVERRERTAVTRTFSVEDAKTAKLWGKTGPWTFYPERMLQMRARSFALRDSFADALKGFELAEVVRDLPPVATVTEVPSAPEPDVGETVTQSRSDQMLAKLTPASEESKVGTSNEQETLSAVVMAELAEHPLAAIEDNTLGLKQTAMIGHLKSAGDLTVLEELQKPFEKLHKQLDPQGKRALTNAYKTRQKELNA